jgi:hypothetical protein
MLSRAMDKPPSGISSNISSSRLYTPLSYTKLHKAPQSYAMRTRATFVHASDLTAHSRLNLYNYLTTLEITIAGNIDHTP